MRFSISKLNLVEWVHFGKQTLIYLDVFFTCFPVKGNREAGVYLQVGVHQVISPSQDHTYKLYKLFTLINIFLCKMEKISKNFLNFAKMFFISLEVVFCIFKKIIVVRKGEWKHIFQRSSDVAKLYLNQLFLMSCNCTCPSWTLLPLSESFWSFL